MMLFTFYFFDRKYSFWQNLVQKKKKNCQFKVKLDTQTIPNMQNSMEVPFLGKFGPKCQNYQFNLKLGT